MSADKSDSERNGVYCTDSTRCRYGCDALHRRCDGAKRIWDFEAPECGLSGATPRTDALRIPSEVLLLVGHPDPASVQRKSVEGIKTLLEHARQLERELAEAEWKALHRLEMFNQREQLIRDLQTVAMRSAPSATEPKDYAQGLEDAYNRLRRPVSASNFSEADAYNQNLWDRIHGKNTSVPEIAQREAALQAQIDRLMLEYCPEEMTEAQTAEWAKHQVCAGPEADAWPAALNIVALTDPQCAANLSAAVRSTTQPITDNDRRWRTLEHGCQWVSFTETNGETHSFDPRNVSTGFQGDLQSMRAFADEIHERQMKALKEGIKTPSATQERKDG